MEQITLGNIAAWLGFLAALGGSVTTIVLFIKKALKALLRDQIAEIKTENQSIKTEIRSVDLENCKNYLVTFLAGAERGKPHDEIELERFHEQYEHYTKIGGNSYIRAKVDKLKAAGKL